MRHPLHGKGTSGPSLPMRGILGFGVGLLQRLCLLGVVARHGRLPCITCVDRRAIPAPRLEFHYVAEAVPLLLLEPDAGWA